MAGRERGTAGERIARMPGDTRKVGLFHCGRMRDALEDVKVDGFTDGKSVHHVAERVGQGSDSFFDHFDEAGGAPPFHPASTTPQGLAQGDLRRLPARRCCVGTTGCLP
jgi:hypothetical protein